MATEHLKYTSPKLRCSKTIKHMPSFKDLILKVLKYFANNLILMKHFGCIGLIPVSFCFLNAATRKVNCMYVAHYISIRQHCLV